MTKQITVASMFGNDVDMAYVINGESAGPPAVRLAMLPLSGKINLLNNNLPRKGMIVS